MTDLGTPTGLPTRYTDSLDRSYERTNELTKNLQDTEHIFQLVDVRAHTAKGCE